MEAVAVAVITTIPPLLALMWRDIRSRTNGSSPLAEKLDGLHDKVDDLTHWQKSHLERYHP